jgi:heat-inducible transcriptional repressor
MRLILKNIIEDYILNGEPVGSKTISKKSNLHLSPATIRNIMSELKDLGLIFQPYTSAGRVPTERGLRFYVDYIIDVPQLSGEEREKIRSRYLSRQIEALDLFRETCRILSSSSNYLGVVWAPRMSSVRLQHIEFVRLRKNHILAIVVSTAGLVHHRMIEMDEDLSQSALDDISGYMSRLYSGLTFFEAKSKLIEQMRIEKKAYDRMLEQALKLGVHVLSSIEDADVFIEGRTNILREEFGNVLRMRELFQAFEEKATMVRLLEKLMEPSGVRIAIGSECQVQEMETCSLVTSTYSLGGEVLGALGVIGPRRMNYSRVIPLVDYTARLLTEALETA